MNKYKILLMLMLFVVFLLNFFIIAYAMILLYVILPIKNIVHISENYFLIIAFLIMLILFAIPFFNLPMLITIIFKSRNLLPMEQEKLNDILTKVSNCYPKLYNNLTILINDRYLFEVNCVTNNIIINRHLIYQLNEEELTAVIFEQCELLKNNIGELNFLIITFSSPDFIVRLLYKLFIKLTMFIKNLVGSINDKFVGLIANFILIFFLPIILMNFILVTGRDCCIKWVCNKIILKADKKIKDESIIKGLISYLNKNLQIDANNKSLHKRIRVLQNKLM